MPTIGKTAQLFLLLFFVAVALFGCSLSGASQTPPVSPECTPLASSGNSAAGHFLWLYAKVFVDAEQGEIEIMPARSLPSHWNILSFLESWPCSDCFRIKNVVPSGTGTLFADIEVSHPFDNPNLTGFDVRGIAMFNGSHAFPALGHTAPDRSAGDGAVVDADGYTSLYNWTTEDMGPGGLEGYFKGRFASDEAPDATLNGYKSFISSDPANIRNAFYSGDSVTVTYEIDLPDGPFVFGYAVDASWEPAIEKPVEDPMADFGPGANCPEAWRIDITETPIGEGLTDLGGSTKLTIDLYDWQGKDEAHPVVLECPELFDGTVEADWKEDHDRFTRYEATIGNAKKAGVGSYICLIAKEAQENNPVAKPWLDLSAYSIHMLQVMEHGAIPPVACAEWDVPDNPDGPWPCDVVRFDATCSEDSDGEIVLYEWDFEFDGTFEQDDVGVVVTYSYDILGEYLVQLRVTDDDELADMLDEPLLIIVENALPVAVAEASQHSTSVGEPVGFDGSGSYDVDCDGQEIVLWEWDWSNDGIYEYEGVEADHSWDEAGTYYVQLRVTDDEDSTDELDEPLEIQVYESTPPLPVDVTPGHLNFNPKDICVEGGYAFLASDILGLHFFDISDPQNPRWVNSVDTVGPAVDVDVYGEYVFVAEEGSGIEIVDIDPIESAHSIDLVDTPGSALAVEVSGGYAWVADEGEGLQVIDIDPIEEASIVKAVDTDNWAWDVTVRGGYAYVADHYQLVIIDIDPLEAAEIVDVVVADGGAIAVDVWGDYAFLTTTLDGLHVIDVSTPGSSETVKILEAPNDLFDVKVSDGYAYVACSLGVSVFDIDPVTSASLVGAVSTEGFAFGVALSDGYASVASYHYGLEVIDIDPISSPEVVGSAPSLTSVHCVEVAGGYAYVGDGAHDFAIVDIDPLESASIVNTVKLWSPAFDIEVCGGYAYAACRDYGLKIIDIDPVEEASVANTVDTPHKADAVAVLDGYAYVADWLSGLQIVDIDPIEFANIIKTVDTPGSAYDVALWEGYAFVADYHDGLQIIDIDPIENAELVKSVATIGDAHQVRVANGYAFVACSDIGLQIIDVEPIETADIEKTVDTAGFAYSVALYGGYAYVGDSGNEVIPSDVNIIDVQPAETAFIYDSFETPDDPINIVVFGDYAWVADWNGGLRVVKLW